MIDRFPFSMPWQMEWNESDRIYDFILFLFTFHFWNRSVSSTWAIEYSILKRICIHISCENQLKDLWSWLFEYPNNTICPTNTSQNSIWSKYFVSCIFLSQSSMWTIPFSKSWSIRLLLRTLTRSRHGN